LTVSPQVGAQAGVLLEEGEDVPNPDVLALVDMEVDVRIDHLNAEVSVTQVFENRTDHALRGRYELALGRGAAVSGFALWEGEHRRQAVVVERERGRQIFEELTRRDVDPGLLETADTGPRRNVYAMRVDPIGPRERVRVEVAYSQDVDLAADEARFVFPMAGREGLGQQVGRLRVAVRVEGAWGLEGVTVGPDEGFRLEGEDTHGVGAFRATLDRRDVALAEDLQVTFRLARSGGSLRPAVLAHRAPFGAAGRVDRSAFGGGQRYTDDRGYFVLAAPVQLTQRAPAVAEPQDVVIALDTSLSMRGPKLERAVGAVEGLLAKLRPSDRFALLTFGNAVRRLDGGLAEATPARREEARRFFREGWLSGGTDLRRAVPAALSLLAGSGASRRTVVLVTDGQPSLGTLEARDIARAVEAANEALGESRARLFVLGVGDDANHTLLEGMARSSEGRYAHVGDVGTLDPVLRGLVHQLGAEAVEDLRLTVEGAEGVSEVYPGDAVRVFDGSAHVVYGRYATPAPAARFLLRGRAGGRAIDHSLTAELPRAEPARRWIARGWARRRIESLLASIEMEGEREEWVREIVALAREHLLVTPYTSLIAAARSQLRPREITPGDPVLRVRTDPTDRAVSAIFPFGLVKPLRRLEPGLFETRFLAPAHLADGRHEVDLVITGRDQRTRVVRDHFVIDSEAPRPEIEPVEGPVRAGARIALTARSDRDTRRLHAWVRASGDERPPRAAPTDLRWSDAAMACVGTLALESGLVTGRYEIVVVAEDHAHNVGTTVIPLEVLGR
jgi:Ca-activated chloride channel family protein